MKKKFLINIIFGIVLLILIMLNALFYGDSFFRISFNDYLYIIIMDVIYLFVFVKVNYELHKSNKFTFKNVVINIILPMLIPLLIVAIISFLINILIGSPKTAIPKISK